MKNGRKLSFRFKEVSLEANFILNYLWVTWMHRHSIYLTRNCILDVWGTSLYTRDHPLCPLPFLFKTVGEWKEKNRKEKKIKITTKLLERVVSKRLSLPKLSLTVNWTWTDNDFIFFLLFQLSQKMVVYQLYCANRVNFSKEN